ncbi:tannase/feruloyl esterase family alpha/beta hydrolase [Niallia oryzisoli]|uniref:Tannase/feruloyl esterase family alpha/beta hydrolase n=1 Tax=Niallia oryzisoli TaxID=1737571 RepID=A0ABZ2CFT7_9BACI
MEKHFGGGFDGVLITGLDNNKYDQTNAPTPLKNGYVTFGSDSGHSLKFKWDGSWALNDEALANFAGDQLKKTHDVAMSLYLSNEQRDIV